MRILIDSRGVKDPVHRIPYCEPCWDRGFASPARVVAGGRARCISCHIDYEKAQEELRESQEGEVSPRCAS